MRLCKRQWWIMWGIVLALGGLALGLSERPGAVRVAQAYWTEGPARSLQLPVNGGAPSG